MEPEPDPAVPKFCALTFDDGPDIKKTALVLEKLEKFGIVASFFVVGELISDDTAPVMRRAVALGCEIHNHSWTYDVMERMTEANIKESVNKTTVAIEKYAGVSPSFFRPPNLAVSAAMYASIDLPFAGGVVGMDWDRNTTAESRASSVLSGMKDGAIILLHDVQPDPHPTPEALDILIPELIRRGYEFVALTDLFQRKGVDPSSISRRMWVYVE